jgi:peptide/nickel transport system permease protein
MLPPLWEKGGNSSYLQGTDAQGRDLLSRLIMVTRISMSITLISIIIGGGVGVTLGIVAGYIGSRVDAVIMRLVDMMYSFPIILLALLLGVIWGPSYMNIILILAILLWARFASQVQGEVLSVKHFDFVIYAKMTGASPIRIMWRHIFPNVVNTMIVMASLLVGKVILLEAGLSFLGVSIPPPNPYWSVIIAAGRDYVSTAWWISAFPSVAIFITVISANLLGDYLRDWLDLKLLQA